MSFEGTVRNGVVILEGATLPDGTRVRVEPVADFGSAQTDSVPPANSLAELLLRFAGAAGDGLPNDLAENHDHYLHGAPRRK